LPLLFSFVILAGDLLLPSLLLLPLPLLLLFLLLLFFVCHPRRGSAVAVAVAVAVALAVALALALASRYPKASALGLSCKQRKKGLQPLGYASGPHP
jgi:hypothetical protein